MVQKKEIAVKTIMGRGVSEIYFILESETTGHPLPFHPFKVFDVSDREIASGETDENGEAHVKVPQEGDYYVVLESDLAYSISGIVYMRDGQTPLAGTELEIKPWGTEAYTVQTGSSGELKLTDIPKGELILSFHGRNYAIYVDSNVANGFFFIPYDERKEPAEEEEMENDSRLHEYHFEEEAEEDIEEVAEIDPDDW